MQCCLNPAILRSRSIFKRGHFSKYPRNTSQTTKFELWIGINCNASTKSDQSIMKDTSFIEPLASRLHLCLPCSAFWLKRTSHQLGTFQKPSRWLLCGFRMASWLPRSSPIASAWLRGFREASTLLPCGFLVIRAIPDSFPIGYILDRH